MPKSFFFGVNSATYDPIYSSTDSSVPIPGRVRLLCLALEIVLFLAWIYLAMGSEYVSGPPPLSYLI